MISKHHQALHISAQSAVDELKNYLRVKESFPWVLSALKQLEFIILRARNGIDPAEKLEGRPFSFGIIASRNLASPDELILQDKLYQVSQLLIKLHTTS